MTYAFFPLSHGEYQWDNLQDEHARAEADRTVEESEAKIERKREELEGLEQDLAQAEKALEEIRDSLKGTSSAVYMRHRS